MLIRPKMSVKPLATTNSSAANVRPFSAWNAVIDTGAAPASGFRLAQVPVEDLLAGPEQHVLVRADLFQRAPVVLGAVRRAHDVGMHHQRHDARGAGAVGVDLLELVHRALVVLDGLVVLDE